MPAPPGRLNYRYEVLESAVRIAPADACSAFGEPAGSELWQCSRLRRYGGRPHSVTHNAQRPELGLRHRADRPAPPSRWPRFSRAQGIELAATCDDASMPTFAPPFVAQRLELTIVDPGPRRHLHHARRRPHARRVGSDLPASRPLLPGRDHGPRVRTLDRQRMAVTGDCVRRGRRWRRPDPTPRAGCRPGRARTRSARAHMKFAVLTRPSPAVSSAARGIDLNRMCN